MLARLLLGLGVFGLALLGFGFVRFVAAIDTVETRPVRHADGIVALTGGTDRVSDAIGLLKDGHADRMLITGVNPSTNREGLARRMPEFRDMVECCIDLGYRALNTVGNARETADWVRANHIRSLIVVTSNYHMPRALVEITEAVPGVDLQAFPVVADPQAAAIWWADGRRARLMVWEYLKYLAAVARLSVLPAAGGEAIATAKG